ncbi:hypothetical protein CNMCM6457_007693 [Aspergillus fumigatiaffinis]|nr:hypothetical protein CNMCM6457_007693 [Aspergillus fumigatiaffinis]
MKVAALLSTSALWFSTLTVAVPVPGSIGTVEAAQSSSSDHPEWPANNAIQPGQQPNAESDDTSFNYWKRSESHPNWPANNAIQPGQQPNAQSDDTSFNYWKRAESHPNWPANNAIQPGQQPNAQSDDTGFTYW